MVDSDPEPPFVVNDGADASQGARAPLFEVVKRALRRHRLTNQPVGIEVWAEMATVSGTLATVLDEDGITAGWHIGSLPCL
jgi:hypothetical protein